HRPCNGCTEPRLAVADVEQNPTVARFPHRAPNLLAFEHGIAFPTGEGVSKDVPRREQFHDLVDRRWRGTEVHHERQSDTIGDGSRATERGQTVDATDIGRRANFHSDHYIAVVLNGFDR